MELQSRILSVDIFDVWVAAIGLRRVKLGLMYVSDKFKVVVY
jgi:hypothetical protein